MSEAETPTISRGDHTPAEVDFLNTLKVAMIDAADEAMDVNYGSRVAFEKKVAEMAEKRLADFLELPLIRKQADDLATCKQAIQGALDIDPLWMPSEGEKCDPFEWEALCAMHSQFKAAVAKDTGANGE